MEKPASGIILADKPEGISSQLLVSRFKRIYGTKSAGHTGTLDPIATGLNLICFGRATKVCEYITGCDKAYIACMQLGLETDTGDTTGTATAESSIRCTAADVAAILPRFTGELDQIPPVYSAIKVGGRKLYELARAGQEVARPARDITIHALELLSCAPPDFTLRVHCSKGTYVRTLCHDLGAALGTGGCMAALRRTAAGAYTAAQAVPLADILAHPAPESLLLPVDTLFAAHPALTLTPAQEKCCRNGASFTLRFAPGRYRLYAESGEFLALGEVRDGRMETVKSFFAI